MLSTSYLLRTFTLETVLRTLPSDLPQEKLGDMSIMRFYSVPRASPSPFPVPRPMQFSYAANVHSPMLLTRPLILQPHFCLEASPRG
jgi:hypothetical protein